MPLRAMTSADFETVAEIDQRAFEELQSQLAGHPVSLTPRERDYYHHWLSTDPEGALVVEGEEGVQGFVFAHGRGAHGWIGPLAVMPHRQGSGAGRELTRAAVDYLRSRECGSIGLDTYAGNPVSVSLYLKLGFSVTGAHSFVTFPVQTEWMTHSHETVAEVDAQALAPVVHWLGQHQAADRTADLRWCATWPRGAVFATPSGGNPAGVAVFHQKRKRGVCGLFVDAEDDRTADNVVNALMTAVSRRCAQLALGDMVVTCDAAEPRLLRLLLARGGRIELTMLTMHYAVNGEQAGALFSALNPEKG